MLKAVLEADQSIPAISSIRHLLRKIAAEDGVLVNGTGDFDALAISLTGEDDWAPSAKSFSFFDNCACRIAKQPVHYEDLAAKTNANYGAVCLLPFCIAEQWPFVIEAGDVDRQKSIAEWIVRLLALLTHTGEDEGPIQEVHSQIVNATKDVALKRFVKKAYRKGLREAVAGPQPKVVGSGLVKAKLSPVIEAFNAPIAPGMAFGPRAKVMESMEGLERLVNEDVEAAVANGRLGRLCRSLSSLVEETRRQGFITLQGMMTQIEVRVMQEEVATH
jgi:nucleolar pre-ribosomal-associated protein 1